MPTSTADWSPRHRAHLDLRLPFERGSMSVARAMLCHLLDVATVHARTANDAVHVLHELLANALDHGSSDHDGMLDVGWTLEAERLTLRVRDAGDQGEVAVGPTPDPSSDRGRGLLMVTAFSEGWSVDRTDGTTVTAWLAVPGAVGLRGPDGVAPVVEGARPEG